MISKISYPLKAKSLFLLLILSSMMFVYARDSFASVLATWTSASTTSIARDNFAATKLSDGKVFVMGGQTLTYTPVTSLYNPSTNTWTSKASMNSSRYNHTSHLVTLSDSSTRVIAIGGRTTQTLATAELYNPTNNTWSYTSNNMSISRASHASVLLNDGKVFVTGGESSTTPKNNVDIYNPITDSWSSAASMSAARYSHTAVLLDDGRVLVAGGQNSGGIQASTEIYDPSTNSWTTGPSLLTARTGHAMVKLSDGNVMVSGGTTTGGGILYSSEIWDPDFPTDWIAADAMDYRRSKHTMTLLDDGRVLVAGGNGGLLGASNSTLNSAEIYDPSTDLWDVTDDTMITARRGHQSVLLDSGSVLMINGYSTSARTTNTEYFTLDP